MGGEDDRPEPVAVAGGRQRDRLVGAGQLGERLVEAGAGEPAGLVGVEDAKARVEPGGDRVGGQQAPAEAVDRRDRRRLAGPGGRLQARPPTLGSPDDDARRESSTRTRRRISAAAFSVKVKARIRSGSTPSTSTASQ